MTIELATKGILGGRSCTEIIYPISVDVELVERIELTVQNRQIQIVAEVSTPTIDIEIATPTLIVVLDDKETVEPFLRD